MVNKFKRFFKSLGGKHSSSSSSAATVSAVPLPSVQFVSGPYGSSSSVAFHASTSRNLSTAELESRLETSGSLTGAVTSNPTVVLIEDYMKDGTIDWATLLAKIPKMVAECTTCSGPATTSPATKRNANNGAKTFADFLALLQQMAGRENQQQVKQFYLGNETVNGENGASLVLLHLLYFMRTQTLTEIFCFRCCSISQLEPTPQIVQTVSTWAVALLEISRCPAQR